MESVQASSKVLFACYSSQTYFKIVLCDIEISSFNGKINGLVAVLELHAKRIDEQKLRVVTTAVFGLIFRLTTL